jgi:hypothetical protein
MTTTAKMRIAMRATNEIRDQLTAQIRQRHAVHYSIMSPVHRLHLIITHTQTVSDQLQTLCNFR